MQRGFPEDFDAWAAMGNDQWSYEKVLPFFRKCERDLDMRDDFHGTDGPMPVRRRQERPVADIQQAFHDACVQLPAFSANNPHAHAHETGRKSFPGAVLRAGAGVRSAH
jgi:choline dehydrogenase